MVKSTPDPIPPGFWREAVEQACVGVCLVDRRLPDQPLVYVNPDFTRLTGYEAEESVGRNCRFLQGADREQTGIDGLRDAVRDGRACVATVRNYRKDGSLFYNEVHLFPIRDDQQRVTHYLGLQHDVTQRVEAEQALVRSEASRRRLIDSLDGVVWEADASSLDFKYVSERARHLLGAPIQAWLEPGFWESRLHPEDRDEAIAFRRLQSQRRVAHELEYRLVRDDGTCVWVRDSAAAISEPDGPALLRGYLSDVSEAAFVRSEAREADRAIAAQLRELAARLDPQPQSAAEQPS